MSTTLAIATIAKATIDLQRMYFRASAKAKKTRHPDDIQEAKNLLEKSKKQEAELDQLCTDIINQHKKS